METTGFENVQSHRWKWLTRIDGPDKEEYAFFRTENGALLALSTDGLLAISGHFSIEDCKPSGKLLVYSWHSNAWELLLEIKLANVGFDKFLRYGHGFNEDGTKVILGDPFNKDMGHQAGAAHVLFLKDKRWDLEDTLYAAVPVEDGYFGDSAMLSADGCSAIVGSGIDPRQNGTENEISQYALDGVAWKYQTADLPPELNPRGIIP